MAKRLTVDCKVAFFIIATVSASQWLRAEDLKPMADAGEKAAQRLRQTLEWLPDETETVIAAQGPFKVLPGGWSQTPRTLTGYLESSAVGSFHGLRKGKYLPYFAGQTVLLSLEGARHFRSPFGLGLAPYDGCHILLFDEKFAAAGDKLMDELKADANRSYKDDSHVILAFDEDWEDDRWRIFVARPQPNVLLCGTDRAYLGRVLNHMIQNRPEKFPLLNLPEWKHVDTKARFWGIRHFDPGNASNDPTTPLTTEDRAANDSDPQATGLTFSFSPGGGSAKAVVKYLSGNKDRLAIAQRQWTLTSEGLEPSIKLTDRDVVEITFSEVNDQAKSGIFWFVLWGVLGHAIYV